MKLRFLAGILIVLTAAEYGQAQSVVSTLIGGTPDGISASLATLNIPCSVASDKNGVTYAGLKGSHQVVRIDKDGIVRLVAGSGVQGSSGDGGKATDATLTTPAGLAFDAAGNLYIADSDANRIRVVGTDGIIRPFAGNGKSGRTGDGGPATAAGLGNPTALAFDRSGNLLLADTWNNVIRKITPGGVISTIAGTGNAGNSGNGGAATAAKLNGPKGVAVDGAGVIYIADSNNAWIRKIAADGTISLFGGVASSSTTTTDTTLALSVSLVSPSSMAVDSTGNLYFVEYGIGRVRRITTAGKISTYAGTTTLGTSGDGGWARFANLNVMGIAMDAQNNLLIADGVTNRVRIVTAADGIIDAVAGNGWGGFTAKGLVVNGDNVYFADTAASRVRKYNVTTRELTVVAGNGRAEYSEATTAAKSGLNAPRGIALDKSGNLYIADTGNNRVRRVTTDGKISTVAGNGDTLTISDGFSATSGSLNVPVAVAVDSDGNLYIAEQSGHRVRKVGTDGLISTIAGTGTAGAPDAESGMGVNQKLNSPQGLAVETAGTLLISDTGNNRIRRLSADGIIKTVAGSRNYGSTGNGGPATSATLAGPTGISTDSAGNIYIADTSGSTIRRVGPDGIITTIGGTGVKGFTGDGSPATAYQLSAPAAVAVGTSCSVLVADTGNQRIRKIQTAVDFTILSVPDGLQISVDGQVSASPIAASWLPGTRHQLIAPSPQAGARGIRYLSTGSQTIDVTCGPARATATVSFLAQYALAVAVDDGGSVTPAAAWQDAGAAVTLQATAKSGYAFAGWEGSCSGTGACQLVMNAPKSVKAVFVPSQLRKGVINSGGVVGGGASVPPVAALSPNAVASIYGSAFAPDGTNAVVVPDRLIDGVVPTKVDGVCVLVGALPAPILVLTPTQIDFQVPQISTSGTVAVQVVTGCGTAQELRSDAVIVPVQSASPEFFYFVHNANGQNPIAGMNYATGVFVGSQGLVAGSTFAPAKPGDTLTLYATGLGVTNPAYAAGVLPDKEGPITGEASVSFGGVNLAAADVKYIGVSPSKPGVYEVRIHVPDATLDGNQPVKITVNGFVSPGGGYITVKR